MIDFAGKSERFEAAKTLDKKANKTVRWLSQDDYDRELVYEVQNVLFEMLDLLENLAFFWDNEDDWGDAMHDAERAIDSMYGEDVVGWAKFFIDEWEPRYEQNVNKAIDRCEAEYKCAIENLRRAQEAARKENNLLTRSWVKEAWGAVESLAWRIIDDIGRDSYYVIEKKYAS